MLSLVSDEQKSSRGAASRGLVRADVAQAEGWTSAQKAPDPVQCEWCGRSLYHYGGYLAGMRRKEILFWQEYPERCDCPEAAAHWERVDAEQRAVDVERERQQEFARMQRRIAGLFRDSGLRGRFLHRTFDSFEVNDQNRSAYAVAKRYADGFANMQPTTDERGNIKPPTKERNGLFITGGYGTGKTHLAASIANQLLSAGTSVICMTMIDLLARIKQTFDRSETTTEADVMRIYEQVPLLIIDDIGSEQPSEWGAAKVFSLINARYESYMPTVITTNYAGDELVRRMTPLGPGGRQLDSHNAAKTLDRLKEMCVGIEMNWESWRSR